MAIRINADRLNHTIQETCTKWGAIPNSTGMRRLALSQEDKGVRDWLVNECRYLGCDVKIDAMGNIFAIRPGTSTASHPIAMGSHLDTQPAGGRYDGILGVLSGLEVLRTLHDNNIKTHSPIALIDWTNEEGARFPGAMMASGVWSGKSSTDLSACHTISSTTTPTTTFLSALQEIGYYGTVPCSHESTPLCGYFELHIEQGPLLEHAQKRIGIVTAVQGMKWFRVRVAGVEGHSGTTPMKGRSDALVTAARMIARVRDVAVATSLGVATVGVIENDTQSQATIPSGVEFILDVRCSTDEMVKELHEAIFKGWEEVCAEEGNKTTWSVVKTWGLPESVFHEDCIRAVREAAVAEIGADMCMEMKSGAGHDAAWTSKVVNSSMIFVPSRDGVSHNPEEYTSPEDCALGAQVLLDAVMRYDTMIKASSA